MNDLLAQVGGAALVAFSGGKDSWVVLDLARRQLERVEAFFLYLVPGLECEERHLRRAEADGVVVHRVPHPALPTMFAQGVYRPHMVTREVLLDYSQADVYDLIRERTGIEWIATGQRRDDGIKRRAALTRCGGIEREARIVHPIWDWPAAQVYSYLRARNLPAAPPIGGRFTGGVSLDGGALRWLRERWPGDYANVLRVFPWAGAAILRLEGEEREQIGRRAKRAKLAADGDGAREPARASEAPGP